MRFLRIEKDGSVTPVEIYGDLPAYGILSHTWGTDNDEVSFKDMAKGRAKEKTGYRKIEFCVDQATKDGLLYFWIDTCCIDKSSSAELTEAINSMFRWYQNSAKCYVYLADVSILHWPQDNSLAGDSSIEENQKSVLQQSRW